MKRILAAILFFVVVPLAAHAWNATGHKAIALIAYGHLSMHAKTEVDRLLSRHPDYATWTVGVPAVDRGRAAFLAASVWPDTIKSDRRFHDEGKKPTPAIPGLPPRAQSRHADWHYINIPFSSDGTPTNPPSEPNILTKLREFEGFASMPEQTKVYVLPWLIHLVGDAHQPLHTLARFTKASPTGDRGGNLVVMKSGNLHSSWDSRIGTSETDRFLNQLTATIQARNVKPARVEMNPEQWIREGFDLRSQVYGFTGEGTAQSPAILSDQYSVAARNTAYNRAALAGYRLAEFLNGRLR